MKHGIIHIIACALLLGTMLGSCRAKKDFESSETVQRKTERVERHADTVGVVEVEKRRTDRSGSEIDHSYTRVIEFDGSGGIQSVSESWRDRRSSDVVVQERHSELVSVAASEKEVIERDSSSVIIHETKHTTADSRPVQGFEWVWIIVGVMAAVVLILFFRQKLK